MANVSSDTIHHLDAYELEAAQADDLKQLLEVCKSNMDSLDEEMIAKAFKLCYLSHKEGVRASGEPYYYHPVEVGKIVASEINIDDVSVVAALLHDTVEDTEITLDDIHELFGDEVALIIDGVTKIDGVFKSRHSKQAEAFMKLLLSMAEDIRVVLIKFADRLHNMRTLHHLPSEKQIRIATETMNLYAPLAHRFGLFRIKNELEDLCFKAIDPTSFKFVARKLKEKKEDREAFVGEFIRPIKKELKKLNFKVEIKGRPKHIYSIYRKMQRQQKPFEEVYDLFAIRIILEDPHKKEDCWRIYSMITDWYTPIPERFRDFISVPKTNGYQSLHTTVITDKGSKVEVQIRTRKMDEIAEKGLAAHWKYKEGSDGAATLDKFVNWVRDVLDNPRPNAATDFVKDFQLNLYQEEIHVFTPRGELRTLPQGATPIDFAFDIHSEVGERAKAAKVNGKMTPLRQPLRNGDQVEIITENKLNLNPDWIEYVVTHKAKSRIRQFIKQKEREVSERGKELWEKRLTKGKIEISDQELTKIAKRFGYDDSLSIFFDIGTDTLDINKLFKAVKSYKSKGRIEEQEEQEASSISEAEIQEQYITAARSLTDKGSLIINGELSLSNVKYTYANCCNPIPGDNVIGFISRTGDIKIHRAICNNARHLVENESERVISVDWAKHIDSKFLGAVKVIGEDRVGMINDITDVLSKSLKTNMKSINVSSDSGMFEGILTLYVEDLQHLESIMKKLYKITGVKNVLRYE